MRSTYSSLRSTTPGSVIVTSMRLVQPVSHQSSGVARAWLGSEARATQDRLPTIKARRIRIMTKRTSEPALPIDAGRPIPGRRYAAAAASVLR